MADYIKREDMHSAIEKDTNFGWYTSDGSVAFSKSEVHEMLNTIPSADVAEVVRCKDCRHRDPEDHKCDCGQLERAGCVFPVDDDYFCAYGERRGGT